MGTMGGPMARRLVESGFLVTGYEPDQTRAGKAKTDGVNFRRLTRSRGGGLRHGPVEPARRGHGAAGLRGRRRRHRRRGAGMIFIDVSTTDPESWREVAKAAKAKGVECLDAPVSGGPTDAGSGKLIFLIGGEADVLERSRPLLSVLGHEIHHIGPLGSGQILKIVNNVMSVGNVAVAGEAMVLGVRAGLDPQRLYDILSTQRRPLASLHQAIPQRARGRFHAVFRHQSFPEGRRAGPEHGGQPRAAHARDVGRASDV